MNAQQLSALAKLFPKDVKIKLADGKTATIRPISLGLVMKIEKEFGGLKGLAKVFDYKADEFSIAPIAGLLYLMIKERDQYATVEDFADHLELDGIAELVNLVTGVLERDLITTTAVEAASGGDASEAPKAETSTGATT